MRIPNAVSRVTLRGIAGAPADATNTVLTSPVPPILLTGGPLRLAAHGLCPPSGWGLSASRDPNAASLIMHVYADRECCACMGGGASSP